MINRGNTERICNDCIAAGKTNATACKMPGGAGMYINTNNCEYYGNGSFAGAYVFTIIFMLLNCAAGLGGMQLSEKMPYFTAPKFGGANQYQGGVQVVGSTPTVVGGRAVV